MKFWTAQAHMDLFWQFNHFSGQLIVFSGHWVHEKGSDAKIFSNKYQGFFCCCFFLSKTISYVCLWSKHLPAWRPYASVLPWSCSSQDLAMELTYSGNIMSNVSKKHHWCKHFLEHMHTIWPWNLHVWYNEVKSFQFSFLPSHLINFPVLFWHFKCWGGCLSKCFLKSCLEHYRAHKGSWA